MCCMCLHEYVRNNSTIHIVFILILLQVLRWLLLLSLRCRIVLNECVCIHGYVCVFCACLCYYLRTLYDCNNKNTTNNISNNNIPHSHSNCGHFLSGFSLQVLKKIITLIALDMWHGSKYIENKITVGTVIKKFFLKRQKTFCIPFPWYILIAQHVSIHSVH